MNGEYSDSERAGKRAASGDATLPLEATPQSRTEKLKIPGAQPPARKPQRSGARLRGPFRASEVIWWTIGGLVLLLFMAATSFFFLRPRAQGFALVVSSANAAPVSDVIVEGVHRGIPSADGTLRVPALTLGKQKVRFADGGEVKEVSGERDGQEIPLTAQAKPGMPEEIEYGNSRMRLIKGGMFTLGSSDAGAQPVEGPPHQVQLEDFYIDVYEVTNALYKNFCASSGRPLPKIGFDPNYPGQDQSPVVGISYEEADAYARSVGKRLPTEAEWEKAAAWDEQQQKKRRWPWGDGPAPGAVALGPRAQPQFAPVGSSAGDRSAAGLMDMAGNAAEWVSSFYMAYPNSTAADRFFGKGYRVVRGADCMGSLDLARTTARGVEPRARNQNNKAFWLIGFRCVVPAKDPALLNSLRQRGLVLN
ncbi:MAG TPA: SUMF1/EgtB/PvdO family nonheme iron enzyme [Blastocatellia bacterium]|nr:SUMF1/EgtB/PvdO family nonheme iron enzyme [Blastocatellia bacterium]